MGKKQLMDIVDRLKKAGIKVSLTKPRSKMFTALPQKENLKALPHG